MTFPPNNLSEYRSESQCGTGPQRTSYIECRTTSGYESWSWGRNLGLSVSQTRKGYTGVSKTTRRSPAR